MVREIDFIKAHGLGNDFVIIDELFDEKIPEVEKADFTRRVCKRKYSIGADGVLFLSQAGNVDLMMRIFNPDGSEAETCMNGLRCSALAYHNLYGQKKHRYTIRTLAGDVKAKVKRKGSLSDVEIQVLGKREYRGLDFLKINDKTFSCHIVNVGNSHCVIFLEESVKDFPVEEVGHQIEYHERFKPDRTNTEFVNRMERNELYMRVHERGACETTSCASGSVATVIAACENGYCDRDEWIIVEQPGGKLKIKYGKELHLRGPAEISFYGKLKV